MAFLVYGLTGCGGGSTSQYTPASGKTVSGGDVVSPQCDETALTHKGRLPDLLAAKHRVTYHWK